MRKVRNKFTASLLAGSVILSGFGAMGAAAEENAEVTEVKYLSTTILETPEGDFEQEMIDKFNEAHPNIHVTVEGVPAGDLNAKLVALATSDDLPAFVMGSETTMTALYDMDMLASAEDVFDADYLEGFVEDNIASYYRDGKLYGIPYFGGAQGIVYRKDVMEELGLEVPTTWDEFVEVLQAMTRDTDGDGTIDNWGIAIVGTRNGSGATRFQPIIHNFGCDEFYQDEDGMWQTDIGSEKYTAALKAFTDLNNEYGVVPPGVVEVGYPEAVALLTSNQANMLITGSNAIGAIIAQAPELKGKLASMPNIPVERSVSAAGGFAFFITTKDEEEQAAAAEFIKYFLEDENEIDFAELTGRIPIRKEARANERVSSMPELEGFLSALENVWIPPTIPGYNEIEDILSESYQAVFTGTMSVEEASAIAGERAQGICDAANNE